MLLWQTRALSALSQDDNIRRLAANCPGNDFNHVLSEVDETLLPVGTFTASHSETTVVLMFL